MIVVILDIYNPSGCVLKIWNNANHWNAWKLCRLLRMCITPKRVAVKMWYPGLDESYITQITHSSIPILLSTEMQEEWEGYEVEVIYVPTCDNEMLSATAVELGYVGWWWRHVYNQYAPGSSYTRDLSRTSTGTSTETSGIGSKRYLGSNRGWRAEEVRGATGLSLFLMLPRGML